MAITGLNDAVGIDVSDTMSHAVVVEEVEHKHIHDGTAFRASKVFSITTGATAYLQIKTGAKFSHLKQIGYALDVNVAVASLIETPVVTDGTTAVAAVNANRNSSNVSLNKLFSDPTSVSGGTTLDTELVPAGKFGVNGAPPALEFNLKPNTNYLISMLNQGGTTSQLLVKLFWYEL